MWLPQSNDVSLEVLRNMQRDIYSVSYEPTQVVLDPQFFQAHNDAIRRMMRGRKTQRPKPRKTSHEH